MILYHVTLDTSEPEEKLFIPRVPKSIGKGENNETPRICFSDNIQNCLQAIHATVDFGTIIRVYSGSFLNGEIIFPQKLKDEFNVPDAVENTEYWYTKPIKLKSQLYKVVSYNVEYVIAWKCIKINDLIKILSKYISNTILSILVHDSNGDPEKLWTLFSGFMTSEKQYYCIDEAWDEAAMLPWAQLLKFCNLKLKLVKED